MMDESLKRLVEAGFPRDRVEPRMKLNSADPAHDIIAEAQNENIRTIALGRRGRSQVEALLLGGVSGKVAHYSQHKTIWIVDAPINESGKVMIAMEDGVEARQLTPVRRGIRRTVSRTAFYAPAFHAPGTPDVLGQRPHPGAFGGKRPPIPDRKMAGRLERQGEPIHDRGKRHADGRGACPWKTWKP